MAWNTPRSTATRPIRVGSEKWAASKGVGPFRWALYASYDTSLGLYKRVSDVDELWARGECLPDEICPRDAICCSYNSRIHHGTKGFSNVTSLRKQVPIVSQGSISKIRCFFMRREHVHMPRTAWMPEELSVNAMHRPNIAHPCPWNRHYHPQNFLLSSVLSGWRFLCSWYLSPPLCKVDSISLRTLRKYRKSG